MATAISNNANPKIVQGGLFFRAADTALVDWKVSTVNAMLADAGTYIIPGIETMTEDTTDGDAKVDTFGTESVLFTTSEGSAVSFRLNADGYNEIKTLVDAGNIDIFFVTGDITEASHVVVEGDEVHYWYDQSGNIKKAIAAQDTVNVDLSWSQRIVQGQSGKAGWEAVIADV